MMCHGEEVQGPQGLKPPTQGPSGGDITCECGGIAGDVGDGPWGHADYALDDLAPCSRSRWVQHDNVASAQTGGAQPQIHAILMEVDCRCVM